MVSGYHLSPVAPATWVNTIPAVAVTSVNRIVEVVTVSDVLDGTRDSDCPVLGTCVGPHAWKRSHNSPSPRLAPRLKTRSIHSPLRWRYTCWRRIALCLQRTSPQLHTTPRLSPRATSCWSRLWLALTHGPQTLRAVSTTSSSLRHCSSSVSRLPTAVDAKPHWGLRARFSIGT